LKKEVISRCPICGNELSITRLHCPSCQIEINGEFSLSRLNYLTKEQIQFVELFLKNQGNIKAIEKDLNISYPTVKKILNEVLVAMGFEPNSDQMDTSKSLQRQEILDRLARKEIPFEEASALLKEIK
jgi:hypothetical protein